MRPDLFAVVFAVTVCAACSGQAETATASKEKGF